jgi:hypothetical protein
MAPEGTSDQNAGEGAAGQNQGDEGNWREENTKLRQQLAEQKALNSRAVPWVNVAIELQKQQPEVFEKLAKGEPLTKAEQKVVDAAKGQSPDSDDAPMTRKEFNEALKEGLTGLAQQMQANNEAQGAMKELHSWAAEALPGYDKVYKTPTWSGILSSVLGSIENGTFQVPQDVEDPYKFAVQTTYDILKAKDPELLKGARRGKSEEDRAAEILAGGRKPSSSSSEDQKKDLPEEIQKELDWIASIGTGGGKKFSP